MKDLAIHPFHRVILITVCAEKFYSMTARHSEVGWETCCRHRHGSYVQSPSADRAGLPPLGWGGLPPGGAAGWGGARGQTSCSLEHISWQLNRSVWEILQEVFEYFTSFKETPKLFRLWWGHHEIPDAAARAVKLSWPVVDSGFFPTVISTYSAFEDDHIFPCQYFWRWATHHKTAWLAFQSLKHLNVSSICFIDYMMKYIHA